MVGALLAAAFASAPPESIRVAVLPLAPLATSPQTAKEVERQLRTLIASVPGASVLPFEAMLGTLSDPRHHELLACSDEACAARAAEILDADAVVTGTVSGLGGDVSVALTMTFLRGGPARHASLDLPAPPRDGTPSMKSAACDLLGPARCANPPPEIRLRREPPATAVQAIARRPSHARAYLVAGAGVALIAAGVAASIAGAGSGRAIDERRTGCDGVGDAYFRCFEGRVRAAQAESIAGAALLVLGGVGMAGGAVLFAWPGFSEE